MDLCTDASIENLTEGWKIGWKNRRIDKICSKTDRCTDTYTGNRMNQWIGKQMHRQPDRQTEGRAQA